MAKTYNELYLAMRRALKEAGVEEYALEARRLLAQGAGYTDAQLIARMYMYAGEEAEKAAGELLQRRLSGEPLAYIAGKWEFYGLEMIVTPSVLIPRMDTEPLVFTALDILKDVNEPRILDLCCGSGCIGLAIAHQLPDAHVTIADISRPALAVAKRNIKRLKLMNRVTAVGLDARKQGPSFVGALDALVCNPPYVTSEEMTRLEPSVKEYEPALALDGGKDGLDFYRCLAEKWLPYINEGGYIAVECGENQADDISAMFMPHCEQIEVLNDFSDVQRIVIGSVGKKL